MPSPLPLEQRFGRPGIEESSGPNPCAGRGVELPPHSTTIGKRFLDNVRKGDGLRLALMKKSGSQPHGSEGAHHSAKGALNERGGLSLRNVDRHAVLVLVTAACCLWIGQFGGRVRPPNLQPLHRSVAWAGIQIFAYLILPVIVCIIFRINLATVGWSIRGLKEHWRPYAGILFVALPAVVAVSFSSEFQAKYPLLEVRDGSQIDLAQMLIWWAFYAVQFLAIESFFRGFLVLGLADAFGMNAVLIAMLPYLAIHFSKPPLEAAASIVGALIMGILALRSRSIWLGVVVHIAVAGTMDVSSLLQKGVQW